MKILLTHGYFLYEDEKEQQIMRPYPPLGILYISSYLKTHGKHVQVVDATFMSYNDWKEMIIRTQPQAVALYVNLMTKIRVLEQVRFLRSHLPDCTIIGGGPDLTYNCEKYLRNGFDFLVIGEGEQTMLELCDALEKGNATSGIEGLAYLENRNLVQTPGRGKLKSISNLPLPDRAAVPLEKYLEVWKQYHGKRTVNISTQRGCPYTCKWCSTAVYGQSYRRNDPKRVVEEILLLRENWGVEALWFVDDVFTVSHKWLGELYDCFMDHHLFIPFEIITRAERLNDEVLMKLQKMGCFRIWIGAESGSQKIIDLMDRKVSLETVKHMIRRTQDFGMEAGTFIMVGYPGEEVEDILLTGKYLNDCRPNLLTITRAYPIKGTGMYEEVKGSLTEPSDWATSTDREITFRMPYSDRFYQYAIRYLTNSWQAKRTGSFKQKLKGKIAFTLMKLSK